jgi:hypothetical protein
MVCFPVASNMPSRIVVAISTPISGTAAPEGERGNRAATGTATRTRPAGALSVGLTGASAAAGIIHPVRPSHEKAEPSVRADALLVLIISGLVAPARRRGVGVHGVAARQGWLPHRSRSSPPSPALYKVRVRCTPRTGASRTYYYDVPLSSIPVEPPHPPYSGRCVRGRAHDIILFFG